MSARRKLLAVYEKTVYSKPSSEISWYDQIFIMFDDWAEGLYKTRYELSNIIHMRNHFRSAVRNDSPKCLLLLMQIALQRFCGGGKVTFPDMGEILAISAEYGHVRIAKIAIKMGARNFVEAIAAAAGAGHVRMVNFLHPQAKQQEASDDIRDMKLDDPQLCHTVEAEMAAARSSVTNARCLQYLIEHFDLQPRNISSCLIEAARQNKICTIQLIRSKYWNCVDTETIGEALELAEKRKAKIILGKWLKWAEGRSD